MNPTWLGTRTCIWFNMGLLISLLDHSGSRALKLVRISPLYNRSIFNTGKMHVLTVKFSKFYKFSKLLFLDLNFSFTLISVLKREDTVIVIIAWNPTHSFSCQSNERLHQKNNRKIGQNHLLNFEFK